MNLLPALGSGLVGAIALNLLHESARRVVPNAPRADILGMRAIRKLTHAAGAEPPDDDILHPITLAGDLVANALYYGLVGLANPKQVLATGAALGGLAGIGAVALPGPLGLGKKPTNRTTATQAMTVGWYLFGGLVAAAVYKVVAEKK